MCLGELLYLTKLYMFVHGVHITRRCTVDDGSCILRNMAELKYVEMK